MVSALRSRDCLDLGCKLASAAGERSPSSLDPAWGSILYPLPVSLVNNAAPEKDFHDGRGIEWHEAHRAWALVLTVATLSALQRIPGDPGMHVSWIARSEYGCEPVLPSGLMRSVTQTTSLSMRGLAHDVGVEPEKGSRMVA